MCIECEEVLVPIDINKTCIRSRGLQCRNYQALRESVAD